MTTETRQASAPQAESTRGSGSPSVLVVAYGLPPYSGIGAERPLRLLAYLASNEWDVSALTARPDSYLPGTPTDERSLDRFPPSVRIVRSGAFRGFSTLGRLLAPIKRRLRPAPPASSGSASAAPAASARKPAPSLKTLVDELAAMPDKNVGWVLPAIYRGMRAFSSRRPDVIYSSGPPWSGHLVAGTLAWMWGRPWVADFRDPWVRSPWTRYTTRTAHAIGARLEAMVVRGATAVTFTTETAAQEFAAQYGSTLASKFRAIPNGCDPSEFAQLEAPTPAPGGPFVILHAGSLYGGRSPVPAIRAAARLCADQPELKQRLRLRFLGATGIPGVDVARLCAELGVEGVVEFGARVSRSESLAQMRAAGALLILQAGLTLAIPGKLYEYFAAGRPVLALCEKGEMADVIDGHGVGLVVAPDDEAQIAAAILRLLNGFDATWTPAGPALFDGRLRAAETASVLETALATRTESAGAGQARQVAP